MFGWFKRKKKAEVVELKPVAKPHSVNELSVRLARKGKSRTTISPRGSSSSNRPVDDSYSIANPSHPLNPLNPIGMALNSASANDHQCHSHSHSHSHHSHDVATSQPDSGHSHSHDSGHSHNSYDSGSSSYDSGGSSFDSGGGCDSGGSCDCGS